MSRVLDTFLKKQKTEQNGDIYMKNNIQSFRKERNWTQAELAALLDVSRQTVISLENGKYHPSIVLAFKISKIFDKMIEDIFIYEDDEE